MMKPLPTILLSLLLCSFTFAQAPKVAFDLSHGQFQDVFVDPSYYDYVLPTYKDICKELGAEYSEIRDGITAEKLEGVKTLVIISPLARSTQKPITEKEKEAITSFIQRGGSVLMFVDEEEYRVILKEYGANDITRQFGIEIGDDIEGLPGNCGAISFENEIFGGRREVPYSGSRKIKGGIPASVCMEGGWLHASYVKTSRGGKLFVAGETMVALLMGYPDGERNVHKMMQTRWWGKDSRLYMKELIAWACSSTETESTRQSAFAHQPGCENLFPDNAVILFQGDSITDGNRGRSADPNHIHGHGYVYLIASDLGCNHPKKNWTFVNRGVSGNTVEKLQQRWEKDTIAVKPDVLSIMVGCNDFSHGVTAQQYYDRYDALLKETVEKLPNVKLIIIEPFYRSDAETLKRYAPFQKAAADLAKKYNAVFVPTQQMYSEAFQSVPDSRYWVWDTVHPTTAGHWLLYKQWLKCVKEN